MTPPGTRPFRSKAEPTEEHSGVSQGTPSLQPKAESVEESPGVSQGTPCARPKAEPVEEWEGKPAVAALYDRASLQDGQGLSPAAQSRPVQAT